MHLPYKQQIWQWPACMSSQASTLIVDVSLRHMQHLWLASTVPQGWQNPVNFAQSHHHFCSPFRLTIDFARPSIPSTTTPFPWDVEKYFHEIVPLTFWVILYLWYMNCDCMMMPSCEILVTYSTPELDPAPSIGRESCSDSRRRSNLMILVVLHI